MDSILITGAAGFIGSHACEAFAARDERVVGLDNLEEFPGFSGYGAEVKRRNLATIAETCGERFEFVQADITDAHAVERVFTRTRPARVLHLAAKAGVTASLDDPIGYTRTNVLGTSVLLEAALRHGCRSFVLASSSSVYGDRGASALREEDRCDAPISPYAATKLAGEQLAHAAWAAGGGRMAVACLRFFTVYGPRQRPDLAIHRFMRLIRDGEVIERRGDGSMTRDHTYIDDIIAGVLSAVDRVPEFGFRAWNLGGDRPVRLDALIAAIEGVAGRSAAIRAVPEAAGDVHHTRADLTRSRAELGYEPRTRLEEGLQRQWAWFSDRPKNAVVCAAAPG